MVADFRVCGRHCQLLMFAVFATIMTQKRYEMGTSAWDRSFYRPFKRLAHLFVFR